MTTPEFKDHFSADSDGYRRYRPGYPKELFAFLASIAPSTETAWDCATGSGQAALKLARHFSTVMATDASEQQIRHAQPERNILYSVARAENAPLFPKSIDVLTTAQALHWFDTVLFFAEAGRVLKNGGIIAVWSYNLLSLTPELDRIIEKFYTAIVGAYWPAERKQVEDGYKDMAFPFPRISCLPFSMSAAWTFEELTGYLGTWSAVKLYREDKNSDPVDLVAEELCKFWGEPGRRRQVTWPLSLIVGKNHREQKHLHRMPKTKGSGGAAGP